jgi:hypothetical protein
VLTDLGGLLEHLGAAGDAGDPLCLRLVAEVPRQGDVVALADADLAGVQAGLGVDVELALLSEGSS